MRMSLLLASPNYDYPNGTTHHSNQLMHFIFLLLFSAFNKFERSSLMYVCTYKYIIIVDIIKFHNRNQWTVKELEQINIYLCMYNIV